jgi:hypothetical protein
MLRLSSSGKSGIGHNGTWNDFRGNWLKVSICFLNAIFAEFFCQVLRKDGVADYILAIRLAAGDFALLSADMFARGNLERSLSVCGDCCLPS